MEFLRPRVGRVTLEGIVLGGKSGSCDPGSPFSFNSVGAGDSEVRDACIVRSTR